LETGTANFEGIAGAAAAVDFLGSLGTGNTRRERLAAAFAGLHEHSMALFAELWNGLAAIPGLTLYGPPPCEQRIPTLSFTLAGVAPEQLSRQLAAAGLFASSGSFYAATVAERYGQEDEGFLRVGLSCYSSRNEVARLVAAVQAMRG
jgi:selenocysteine lyase/cysteine desulfurase